MYRAVLEGAAFVQDECMRDAKAAGATMAPETTVVDAGVGTALWRRIVADITRTPLRHITAFPGTAFGAAMLAALGGGLASEEEVLAWVPQSRVVEPTRDPTVLKAYADARKRFWETHRALHGPAGAG
jgi:xylulokinase